MTTTAAVLLTDIAVIVFATSVYFLLLIVLLRTLSVLLTSSSSSFDESEEEKKCTLRLSAEILMHVSFTMILLHTVKLFVVECLFPFKKTLLVSEIQAGTMFLMMFNTFYGAHFKLQVEVLSKRLRFVR